MDLYQNKYRIKSARLKEWDYSTAWRYYVTINIKNVKKSPTSLSHSSDQKLGFSARWFGDVINDKMVFNEFGKIVDECWNEIPIHYSTVELDYYQIMPNHIHGIIILNNPAELKTNNSIQNQNSASGEIVETPYKASLPPTLGDIVGKFKGAVTREIHKIGSKSFSWQPRFYDRIIRNEKELYQIRKYIEQNPLEWSINKDNPENLDL
ncbi:MAG: transposase [bacterium]